MAAAGGRAPGRGSAEGVKPNKCLVKCNLYGLMDDCHGYATVPGFGVQNNEVNTGWQVMTILVEPVPDNRTLVLQSADAATGFVIDVDYRFRA